MLPGRMSVRGSLRTMSVEDLLDWVDRRSLMGTLTVEWSSTVRSFVLGSGSISATTSNIPGEHLGQLLLRSGLIDEGALGGALETQAETGVSLGRILAMIGAVQESVIRQVLDSQAYEAVFDAFLWPDGDFAFEPGPPADSIEFPIAVPLRPCIEEGQWRLQRWQEIRALIPADDLVLAVSRRSRIITLHDDDAAQQEIEALVAGVEQGWAVDELVSHWGGRRFAILDRLARLMERGALRIADVSSVPVPIADGSSVPVPIAGDADSGPVAVPVSLDEAADASGPLSEVAPERLEAAARARAAGGDRLGAYELARQALDLAPDNASIQHLYRDTERAYFAVLSRELLTSFRVPRLLVPRGELAHLSLSDSERYLACRVDGRWDLFSLLRVSRLREVEALITFKQLADRGIIAL